LKYNEVSLIQVYGSTENFHFNVEHKQTMTENKDKPRENRDNQRERERRWAYLEATKAGEWLGKGGDWNGEVRRGERCDGPISGARGGAVSGARFPVSGARGGGGYARERRRGF
jgi:hypothetical protein